MRLRTPKHLKLHTLALLSLSAISSAGYCLDLATVFELAQGHDPSYQAAISEKDANKAEALRSRLAYLPSAKYTQTRSEYDTLGDRKTTTVSQPIFDSVKGATFLQGGARSDFADSSFLTKQHDLAQRVLKAVNQIILTTEAIETNQKRIDAFDSQYQGAKRKFELGQGTITDMRDIEVKFQQAKADHLTLKANKKIAEKQFSSITGQQAPESGFRLANTPSPLKLDDLDVILHKVSMSNPQVLTARANEKINKLDVAKAVGSLAPTVYATNTRTDYNNVTNSYNGITINFPLEIGGFVGAYGAHAKSAQAINQRMDTEEKTKVEAERLYQLVVAGQESVQIKKSAVEFAQLSVEANQKSFQAGVRSTTDVLNSIQVLFQVKNEYVQAVTQLSETYLNLALISSEDPASSLNNLQSGLMVKSQR
jgi:outer membrane protein TolC